MQAPTISTGTLSPRTLLYWRIAQVFVWLVGAFILLCLLFFPSTGILLFWDILIPVAPALFVVGTGVWRNVCPLATTNLLPRHLELSKRKRLTLTQLGQLNLLAVIILYAIVPLRHALFNNSGMATSILIISMVITGVALGLVYEWKSAGCSGLCPVHPVEKLYGENVSASLPNAHCTSCRNCVIPCPDSTPNINAFSGDKTFYHQVSGFLITGGLPGFIWGWFHVPDEANITSLANFLAVYKMPLTGMVLTLFLYAAILRIGGTAIENKLTRVFAAAAVSFYYGYRIPSLFGFGKFATDGLLVNLKKIVPEWSIYCITISVCVFFFYWLVFRGQQNKSWIIRPPYAIK